MKYVACPTCDESAVIATDRKGLFYWYKCDKCKISGTQGKTREEAEALWIMMYFGEGLKPCSTCHHTKFWVGPHGWAVCERCHPPSDKTNIVTRVVSGPDR